MIPLVAGALAVPCPLTPEGHATPVLIMCVCVCVCVCVCSNMFIYLFVCLFDYLYFLILLSCISLCCLSWGFSVCYFLWFFCWWG